MLDRDGVSYHALDDKTATDEEQDETQNHQQQFYTLKCAKRRSDIIAILLGLTLLLQTLWVWLPQTYENTQRIDHYGTDFSGVKSTTIDKQELSFDGWVWDEEYKFIKRPIDLSKPQYFGDPRVLTEIEDNWNKLFEVQFFALSEEESQAYPDLIPNAELGHKYMELDVTHKLHCVNKLRKLLYNHYYNHTVHALQSRYEPPGFYLEHMDHCLENLFQGVICHSDLTPAPLHSFKSFTPGIQNSTFSISGTHTCRNFEQVQEWLYERAEQRPSYGSTGKIYEPEES